MQATIGDDTENFNIFAEKALQRLFLPDYIYCTRPNSLQ